MQSFEQLHMHTFGYECNAVALMNAGHLLLAARKRGLVDYIWQEAQEFSCWVPPLRRAPGFREMVHAVAVLDDGRVAVALRYAQQIVLLRRSTNGDAHWIEDRRFDPLTWIPGYLSSYQNVLAVSGYFKGRSFQLTYLNTLESTVLQRQYGVQCVAVTATLVITGSCTKVRSQRRGFVYVVEARSLENDIIQQWRYELQNDELVTDIVFNNIENVLYIVNWNFIQSAGRLSAHSLDDGSTLRNNLLLFEVTDYLLPSLISYRNSRIVEPQQERHRIHRSQHVNRSIPLLAALCYHEEEIKKKTVVVYRQTEI